MSQYSDDDDRRRCWDCQHWTRLLKTAVNVHDKTGKPVRRFIEGRTCEKGLAHDPIPLRRCDHYRRKRPEHILPLPKGAVQGWGTKDPSPA